MKDAAPPQPLAGLRVIDFTHVLAGPACGYMLGLLGAEVIKVESPRGDAMRWRGGSDTAAASQGRSTAWATQAAGKSSIVLDLESANDRRIMDQLLSTADVLVENHLPTRLEHLGLTDLEARFPALIHCAMTGYGRGGELENAPAYDVNIQAASGLMSLTGTTETGPLRTGAPVMDYGTALAAGFAICAALVDRARTGRGQFVDVSMLDTALFLMASTITDMTATGHIPKPRGNAANSRSPTAGTFPCRSGLIALGVNEERHFAALAETVGRTEWLHDPRFATRSARAQNKTALAEDLIDALSSDDAPAWENRLRAAGVAVSVLRSLDAALDLPHLNARGVLHDLPGGGRAPGLPFMLGTHRSVPSGPPGSLGADTKAVIADLARREIAAERAKPQLDSFVAFDAGDALLHVRRISGAAPNLPRLICVNSLGCDLRIWDRLVRRLRGEFDICIYDKRGHGLSEKGTPPYTIASHAADLIALIEYGGSPVFVCGLSIGGMIAMRAALDRSDLIRGLILCDTAPRIGNPDRYMAREGTIRTKGMSAFADEQIDRWFSDQFRQDHPATVRLMRSMLMRQPMEGYVGSVAALRDADLRSSIGAITVPTHCVVGSKDLSTPPDQVRSMAKAIPDATFAEIEGAGHLPCIEAPDVLAAEIRAFVRRIG